MKRYRSALVILGIMFWCVNANAMSPWRVMDPTTFKQKIGNPVAETRSFFSMFNQATLKISSQKVNDATVAINGQVIFGPLDFNRDTVTLESIIPLVKGENTLEVLLNSQPGSQIVIQILQEAAGPPPETVLARTAKALRAGNIELVLKGFFNDEKTLRIIPSLDAAKRNQLADMLEDYVIVSETERSRSYRHRWTDESGKNSVEFAMAIDFDGNWAIVSW